MASKTRGTQPQAVSPSLSRGHLNDFTQALGQQMYFWGRDVLHEGNLLIRYGFQKRPSTGLQGTSCYSKPWRQGMIELHGACAGWYPTTENPEGFLFIRSDKRCYVCHQAHATIPGRYEYQHLNSGKAQTLLPVSQIFASWLVDYERWIHQETGTQHRQQCFQLFRQLPTSKPWLPPHLALRWLSSFAHDDRQLLRSRHWSSSSLGHPPHST